METILDLGELPLADELTSSVEAARRQAAYPLSVAFCPACTLVQIRETLPPETLFGSTYPYYSSYSDELVRHAQRHARQLIENEHLTGDDWVVEIASNDGYLLRHFMDAGIPVLGIDPASGPVTAAIERGIPTLRAFFSHGLARQLRTKGRPANVIVANNVLAHVADTNGFVAGLKCLLAPDGVISIEFPYVRDLVDHCEFDTIYHEHLCYFSLCAVRHLFARHDLIVHDVQRIPIHGGSLRITISHDRKPSQRVAQLLAEERELGLHGLDYYQHFAGRVETLRTKLRDLLAELRGRGKRIAAYGAAAKGAILLNYVGIDNNWIDFVVDRNVHKQGCCMPRVGIPVREPAELLKQMPDYVLLLAWNFRDEILQQQRAYLERGGRFVIPIPEPRVLDDEANHATSLPAPTHNGALA